VPPRPRVVRAVVRRRVALLRGDFEAAVLRGDFEAVVARFAVLRFAAGLRAVDARLDPDAVFARDDVAFLAPAERDAVGLRAVDFRALDLRPPLRADRDDEPELELLLASPSIDHLPDITRCAASATASAISEPSFVALDATLLAACCAVSAASSPASRIALRAFGLAAIAAAAAVKPAASISLLIAALAILSIVSDLDEREALVLEEPDLEDPDLEELDLEEPEELLRADLAIAYLPRRATKTL
jgi:hypothetical protein